MEKKKTKGQKKEKTENSSFHHFMTQTTDVEEDPVCLKLHVIEVIDSLLNSKIKSTSLVLQRLIVIARLSPHLADRTELGAHHEELHSRLGTQYMLDQMTGLLLIYPSCLLHVIESSRDVLVSVLRDLTDMQQQPDGALVEASKVVFMEHNPQSRMFKQWSYEVLDGDQGKRLEEEESTEALVLSLLSALQKLPARLPAPEADPGSVGPGTPEPSVSQTLLTKLLARDELLTPQQHLQMFNSPLNISTDAGQVVRSSCLSTV
ncbi:testis-expressed protein 47 isoform X2 [Pungitius pungitius]|uniref:testis-expressed protein 47 isoform X2 n=1 Tax=Pungitius pungitius TaxID=134920 RepID=UPI0018898E90|nr:testis-expressed protein 47 isoform X2 [Pungitius pungitius]